VVGRLRRLGSITRPGAISSGITSKEVSTAPVEFPESALTLPTFSGSLHSSQSPALRDPSSSVEMTRREVRGDHPRCVMVPRCVVIKVEIPFGWHVNGL
jgi:hypothetical protein